VYEKLAKDIYTNILGDGRYLLYLEGLGNTFIIALGATTLGILIGAVIAIIKVYAVDDRRLWPLEKICNIYLTVIRALRSWCSF
jgi:ABC-type amino acid transport system permease subunit